MLDSHVNFCCMQLPLHPLVVHAPVVLVPVASIGIVMWVLMPQWGYRLRYAQLLASGVGVATAQWANVTGVTLLENIGLTVENPGEAAKHMWWGSMLVVAAASVFLCSFLLWWLAVNHRPGFVMAAAQLLSVVCGVVAFGVTIAAGHSGAELVWG